MEVLFLLLLLFGLYTIGFVIPAQLKDISKRLEEIIALLENKNG